MMSPELMALAVEFSKIQLLRTESNLSIQPSMVIQSYEPPEEEDDDDDLPTSGLSIIPISGPLVPRTGNLQMCQQMTAYEQVAAQINAALADPECSQIVFDIDSTGGASTGAFELANKIKAAGAIKPTTAIVNFNAMSGAYLIAAACNEISLSQTGGVGSIGVIAQHMDVSKMNEAMGLKITAIYKGDKKNNLSPNEPLNESSMNELSTMVEKTYQQFVSAVSDFRSLPMNQVIDTQAGLYFGQDAIDAGLADRLETPQDAINRIASQAVQTRSARVNAARQIQISKQSLRMRARAMNLSIQL
jgi:signal peptide peptidase SppA